MKCVENRPSRENERFPTTIADQCQNTAHFDGEGVVVDGFEYEIQRMYGIAMNRHLRHVGDEYQWNIGVHLT